MLSSKSITREKAIELLARQETLSNEIRADALQRLHAAWDGDLSTKTTYSWCEEKKQLTPDSTPEIVFQKIVSGGLSEDFLRGQFANVSDSKYDEVLTEHCKDSYEFLDNHELRQELHNIGVEVQGVTGILKLFACPCCGYETLPERHGWEICIICRWEDDGTDNDEASLYFSGPNKGLQLTAARINYLKTGISNPLKSQSPDDLLSTGSYIQGRSFAIDELEDRIFEEGGNWSAPLTPPHLDKGQSLPKVSLAGAGLRDWPPLDE